MKLTRIITNPLIVQYVTRAIEGLDFDEPHEVRIRPHKANRSASQQGVQWMWNTDIGNFTGMTKDEAHEEMKRKFCVSILIRDDDNYREMWLASEVLPGSSRTEIVRMTSTTRLNLTQMAEYLTEMERHAAEFRIPLRHPDDYKYAMGIKKGKK